jgi:Zn-dependent protease with chaperone function
MAICQECVFGFFLDPLKVSLSFISIALSIWFFVLMKNAIDPRKKARLIYAHLFTAIFPIAYYMFTNGCMNTWGMGFCNALKPALTILLVTSISSIVLGYLLTPFMLKVSSKTSQVRDHSLEGFLGAESKKAGIETPALHLIDSAKPQAFCVSILKPRIYVSIGLSDLLSKKEMEAVLLHEIGHLKRQHSWLKFSTYLHKLASPFSVVTNFNPFMSAEEKAADDYAISVQGAARHIESAKSKLSSFESEFAK